MTTEGKKGHASLKEVYEQMAEDEVYFQSLVCGGFSQRHCQVRWSQKGETAVELRNNGRGATHT
eukprot:3174871-Amphidinium_carterae.1